MIKIISALSLLFVTYSASACFNDAGCPKGNVCVKTGNLIGICLSQAMPLYGKVPTLGGTNSSSSGVSSTKASSQAPARVCSYDIDCATGDSCIKSAGSFKGVCQHATTP